MVRYSNLDNIDERILETLQDNSRTPYTKIAKIVGLSEAAIRKRIRKLERLGIIKKYTIEIDYKILGYKIALIGIDAKPEYLVSILEKLKNINNIRSIYLSSGDHDVIVEFIYRSQEELNDLIKNLENTEGVTRVCPAVLVEKYY